MNNLKQTDITNIQSLATFLRYWALRMSTQAGSGHPSSALSAADLMATLFATTFRFDFSDQDNSNNDRLIFSKGHATPLYYGLFAAAGAIPVKELDNYRKFSSNLEGHPTFRFPYAEAATGSLGQGLSIGVGMALAMKMNYSIPNVGTHHDASLPRVFVLLGDGEMAEGSVWEAAEVASKYKLNNLIGILDVNRLGQSGETMLGWDTLKYQKRMESFGWKTKVINGHDYKQIINAFSYINKTKDCPYMIIAKTVKGKGVSFIEGKNGWHGKPLPQEDFEKAVKELGPVDVNLQISVKKPQPKKVSRIKYNVFSKKVSDTKYQILNTKYKLGDQIATRRAYGEALARIGSIYPNVVALDGDVKNSTYSEIFKERFPERFFEMYIAEQNMVGTAVGLAKRGFIPFVSTFAAFFTRAFDQIRMGALSQANIKFCGSHAGVSIGEDGPSQMGLEDLAMFRAVNGCLVVYPADAVSTDKLVQEMAKHNGMVYMRTTRPNTPVIYDSGEEFPIGGSKIHKIPNPKSQIPNKLKSQNSKRTKAVIVAAGITLHEALKARQTLAEEGIETVVIDCYSIKPIDEKTIRKLGKEAGLVVTVEDHWFEGGLGDAVLNVFAGTLKVKVVKLAVKDMPMSGKSAELLAWARIDAKAIIKTIKEYVY